jgi:very-short-patch-repair endonuclease
MKMCDYGCGKEAKFQMTSGKWCCEDFYSKCPNIKNKNSSSVTKALSDPKVRKKLRECKLGDKNHFFGKHHDEESLKKMRIPRNEEFKKKMKRPKSEKARKSFIEAQNRPEVKKKIFESNSKDEVKAKRSKSAKECNNRLDVKDKLRKASLKNWRDPIYVEKQMIAQLIRPNKPESLILELLNKMFPNEWKYTGDFSFMINGKNPDFTNFEKKKIIEFFGDYYHKGENPENRKRIFNECGYEAIVIWEHEMKNIEMVISRIKEFNKKGV